MRNKRALKSIYKTIKRYEEEVELITETSEINKNNGEFEKIRIKKIRKMAIFKKKNYFFLDKDGNQNHVDIKVYSTVELKLANKIVLKNDKNYKIVFVDEREESVPIVYIAYGVEIND
jgi:hypothetical protein